MANIRTNLMTFLPAQAALAPLIGERVNMINRPEGSGNETSLVLRVINGQRGEVLGAEEPGGGDDGIRTYQCEIVVWADSIAKCMEVGDVLLALLHGSSGYQCGDQVIGSSWYVREFDGDRLLDGYTDAGMYAITYVYEFIWEE